MADWRTELGRWGDIAAPFLTEDWCRALTDRIEAAYEGDKPVYPPRSDLFTALRLTPPEGVRCVILGQDPYPGKGQAHGLALLLNNVLTVYGGEANSHKGWGWEEFTARLLLALQGQPRPIAFLLWGRGAQTKGQAARIMDSPYPRLIIETAHPSPLSARRGFFGSKPFSRVNQFLEEHGETPICWAVER